MTSQEQSVAVGAGVNEARCVTIETSRIVHALDCIRRDAPSFDVEAMTRCFELGLAVKGADTITDWGIMGDALTATGEMLLGELQPNQRELFATLEATDGHP